MTNLVTKWRADQEDAAERERLRQAYERGPALRNDPRLLERVRCRVLKRFGIGGGEVGEPGEIITLARHDALSMAALGRVVPVERA